MDPIKTTAVTDAEGNFDVTVTVGGGPGIKKIGVQAGETGAPAVTSAQSVPAPGATTTGGPTTTAGPGSTTTTTTTPAPTTTPSPQTTNITFSTVNRGIYLLVRYTNAAGATVEASYRDGAGGTIAARVGTRMELINNGPSGTIIVDGVGSIPPRGFSIYETVPSTATTYNFHF